ncbi:MAG: hypothetical protein V4582_14430 [Pseudomonadota bacterium]
MLGELVRAQLSELTAWAALPRDIAHQSGAVFALLSEGAMQGPAIGPHVGLSRINASGLPFQWSFSLGSKMARSVRFLCEAGHPGDSALARYTFSRACLTRACAALGIAHPCWLDECVFAHVMPALDEWPQHWRSAIWFGVGASARGVLIKPYVNLNWGSALARWRRVGQVFKALGRWSALTALCELSGQVSRDSWPVGLAFDVLPDGQCGRVKVYFRSGAVDANWLERWYRAAGAGRHAPALRSALDAFPHAGCARYPDRAFVVSLEFHEDDIALKTDLALTRWMGDDAAIAAGARRVLRTIGGEPRDLDAAVTALGLAPLSDTQTHAMRFVGLGHEPDGSCHLNVYIEPAVLPQPPALPSRSRHAAPGSADGGGGEEGLRAALAFLIGRQQQGVWSDYALPVGVADQWITAYVLWMLAGLPQTLGGGALQRAIDDACASLLEVADTDGAWGYNGSTGADADSTSIAVLALRAHARPLPAQALAFLAACRAAGGGMGTYPGSSMPGGAWAEASCEVSAVAMMALNAARVDGDQATLRTYLARHRQSDGMWPAYWWHTPLYPTYLALLADPGALNGADVLGATLERFEPIGAFETALLLLCCQPLRLNARAATLKRRLLALQLADGSWEASALLRLTDPTVRAPAAVIAAGTSYLDQQRVFTTATVVAALIAARAVP